MPNRKVGKRERVTWSLGGSCKRQTSLCQKRSWKVKRRGRVRGGSRRGCITLECNLPQSEEYAGGELWNLI